MRAGLSTIQQTLTPEAATVLNHSIAEASRRNHGQTTPLHVAATLLSSPSGFLRQACIKSHPNSSHPLQCRALELCFSVALERLPTAQNLNSGIDPPISNALMAALKRAQAHQRRGCPEQQQQPLLAVKVELEQLIISILDDPSVSRVMREASFSSPAVKNTIEQSISSSASAASTNPVPHSNSVSLGLGFRAPGAVAVPIPVPATPGSSINRNSYLNPRLQQGGLAQPGQQRNEETKRVIDILSKTKKKNPVLVGESEPELVVKEALKKIEAGEYGVLKNVQVIHLEKEFLSNTNSSGNNKEQIPAKIMELGGLIESRLGNSECQGVVLDLGDLKWLVEQPATFAGSGLVQQHQQQIVSEAGRAAVAEMGKLLRRFGEGSDSGKVWLIGTATCETYLRCQVYHPSMEHDWDLQAVPIAPRAPLPGMFPRFGNKSILGSPVESLSPLKGFTTMGSTTPRRLSENFDPARRNSCCHQCTQNYEQELATISPKDIDKSSEVKPEAAQSQLPLWLQSAKSTDDANTPDSTSMKDQELVSKHKSLELQKKWHDTCLRLHPGYHQRTIGSERMTQPSLSMTGLFSQDRSRQPFQPKLSLNRNIGGNMLLNPNLLTSQTPTQGNSPPGSPVRTELALGRPKVLETASDKIQDHTKDFLGCVPSEQQPKVHELQTSKLQNTLDIDSFKKLLKGLLEKVWWQREAASAVATTVTQCKLGNGRRCLNGTRGDIWLLFTGPDRVGKKKMTSSLSELVCGGNPITVHLGSRRDNGESDISFRGKTVVDRIAEAVRKNPSSVIMLEDIDEADALVRGSIKRAVERGRISDSLGREISLGNVIFILTANWLPDNLKFLSNGVSLDEQKLTRLVSGGWQLRLSLTEKTAKRRASWLPDEERLTRPKKGTGLSFDLNEAADVGDDKADGSHNSSELTNDHEDEQVLNNNRLLRPTSSTMSPDLLKSVDDHIVFKPVDFGPIRRDTSNAIAKKFSAIVGAAGIGVEIQDDALEKIVGGVWLGRTGLEEWVDRVLVPSLQQLKLRLPVSVSGESMVVRLESDGGSDSRSHGDWLPSNIKVVVGGTGIH